MFKKELVNVFKQSLIFLAILAALPAAILVLRIVPKQPYQALFTPAVQAGLLFWSFFLGASLFGRERGQRALEYTASLPYSRLGLLARLAAPRILVVAFIGSLTLLIPAGWWQSYAVLPPALFGLSSLLLFTIALSFAPLFENFLVLAFSTLLAFFLVGLIPFATVFLAYRSRGFPLEKSFLPAWGEILSLGNGAFPIGVLPFLPLLAFPFVAALMAAFPKFDIRPSPAFRRRFAFVLAPAFILSGLIVFAAVGRSISATDRDDHYLTKDLRLVEFGFLSNRVVLRDGKSARRIKLKAAGFWNPYEDGGYLYFMDLEGALNRLDLATGQVETLYPSSPGSPGSRGYWACGGSMILFENGGRPDTLRLVQIDPTTKTVRRIPFTHPAFAKSWNILIGAGTFEGRAFWLDMVHGRRCRVLRLWEDGRAEEAVAPEISDPWRWACFEGLLFHAGKDRLTVLKDTGKTFEPVKTFPDNETFSPPITAFTTARIDRPSLGFIAGKRGNAVAKLDLASLSIEDIGKWTDGKEGRLGSIRQLDDGRFFLVVGSRNLQTIEISDLSQGQVRPLWSSQTALPGVGLAEDGMMIFPSGILVNAGGEWRAYAFPDMREIKFK